ncbi:MAG: hypothetical protein DRO99_03845, partial [Candidatus Aenigmatarchaeota archaeon]
MKTKTITILIGLLAFVVPVFTGCDKNEDEKKDVQVVKPNEEEKPEPRLEKLSYGSRIMGSECLVNEYGVRIKVIINRPGIRCSSAPGGSPDGAELKFFRPYFVFKTYPEGSGSPSSFLIGSTPSKDNMLGWVDAGHVQRWDHRIGDRYARTSGRRPRLYVFRTQEDASKWTGGDRDVKPIARASMDYGTETFMPWPVIEKRKQSIDGHEYEFHRIAFLGEYKQGTNISESAEYTSGGGSITAPDEMASEEEQKRVQQSVRMVDIVFVIDTTSSMQDVIDATKKAAKTIANGVEGLSFGPDVAFGMVEYRDYVDKLYFNESTKRVYKVYPLVSDINQFRQMIEPVSEANVSSQDYPEAVYDGVNAALRQINWRGKGLSTRIIVLLGDNSAHEPGHVKNPHGISSQDLVNLANRKDMHVTIFGICCPGGGGSSERDRHRSQFTFLAEKTGGKCYNLDNASRVVSQVDEIVRRKMGGDVKARVFVVDTIVEKGLEQSREEILAKIPEREFTEVL